jgi:hypothetical protein
MLAAGAHCKYLPKRIRVRYQIGAPSELRRKRLQLQTGSGI